MTARPLVLAGAGGFARGVNLPNELAIGGGLR